MIYTMLGNIKRKTKRETRKKRVVGKLAADAQCSLVKSWLRHMGDTEGAILQALVFTNEAWFLWSMLGERGTFNTQMPT